MALEESRDVEAEIAEDARAVLQQLPGVRGDVGALLRREMGVVAPPVPVPVAVVAVVLPLPVVVAEGVVRPERLASILCR